MNKKGFTIAELIAVILILGTIVVLVVPSITSSSSDTQKKMFENKIEYIETQAVLYANSHFNKLVSENKNSITVGELLEKGYIKADKTSGIGVCVVQRTSNMCISIGDSTGTAYGLVTSNLDNNEKYINNCPISIEINLEKKTVKASLLRDESGKINFNDGCMKKTCERKKDCES